MFHVLHDIIELFSQKRNKINSFDTRLEEYSELSATINVTQDIFHENKT